MSASFSRSLTRIAARAASGSSRPAPAVFAPTFAISPASSSSSSSPSTSRRAIGTSVPRTTQHNSDESSARAHRRPLGRDNHEDFSSQPRDNATRDRDEAYAQQQQVLDDAASSAQMRPGAAPGGADPANIDPTATADAAQGSASQASIDIHNQAATASRSPRKPRAPLQSGGYGYTPQTIPTRTHPTLELLINTVMRDGKKATAQRLVLGAVKYLSEALNTDPLPAIQEAIVLGSPLVRFKRMYLGGGKIVQCPVPLTEKAGRRRSAANLVQVADRRSETKFEVRLAKEILAVLDGNSGVLKKKEEIHKEGVRQRGNLNLPPSSFK